MSYDPHYANVSLLLHGDGADGSSTFADNSSDPKTVYVVGSVSVGVDHVKFGGGAAVFAGGTNGLEVGDTSWLGFGSGDYTVEAWVYVGSASSYQAIFDNRLSGKQGISLYIGDGGKAFTVANNSTLILSSSISAPLNQWYHLAIVRNGGILTGYVNGVADGNVSDYRELAATAGAYIGRSTAGQGLSGYIDDIRITKGVARYTESFTPPAAAFPNYGPPVEVIASASTPLGAASAYAQSVIVSQAQANTPLGSALAFAFSGHIAFAAADTPLGSVSALSVVVSACRIAVGSPLGVPATLASYAISARVSAASPLGIAQSLAWHDFTGQIGDTVTRYVMDLITPSGTVRVPISSWQATLRTGASSYVQCVIPAAQQWGAAINAATSFRIYRRAVTASGQVIEYMMAEAPADTPQFDRGPTNHTCTLSGYAPGFAAQDVSPGADRTLTGIRSISSGASYRVRCAVDWLLRPGQRGVVDGVPFVVEWINYYVNTTDAYMEAGT